MRARCKFVGIASIFTDEQIGILMVLPTDEAIAWVNSNRDITDNCVIRYYDMDYAYNNELDIEDVDLEAREYMKLTPRFGADWQSTKCDAFTQLFTS